MGIRIIGQTNTYTTGKKEHETPEKISEVGEKIKALREEAEMTQKQLADMVDINVRTIRKIESCKYSAHPDTLGGLFLCLGYELKFYISKDGKSEQISLFKIKQGVKNDI